MGGMNLENYEQELKERAKAYKGVKYEFQAVCKDMANFFPKAQNGLIWSLPHKYVLEDIKYAFKVCEDKGIKSVKYLLGILKNK